MLRGTENAAAADAALAPLLAAPDRSAILLDLDGTLAPIVARPEDAAIPARAREALRAVADRYALTAIVTGRPPDVAREIVGIDAIAYAGNHGFELLGPGASTVEPSPALGGRGEDAASFARGLADAELEHAGVRVEDKGPIVALHWRGSADEAVAERLIRRIAALAEASGLVVHHGRKVLELRPAVALDKGVAVTGLLAGAEVRVALYAGDDRTDLDAFRALRRLQGEGDLDTVVRVGVRSVEGPAEIVEECDLAVDGPEAIPPLLEALAG